MKLCNNRIIQKFNKKYLHHDYPTDVLAFPSEIDGHEDSKSSLYIGDCLVSVEMAIERSKEFRWTADEELMLYIIHGILHLLGYRDKKVEDTEIMDRKQKEYMDAIEKENADKGALIRDE